MSDNDKLDVAAFRQQLDDFRDTLSPPHRELLDVSLKIAWITVACKDSLDKGFTGCFEPEQADLLLKYHKQGEKAAQDEMLIILPRVMSIKGSIN